MSFATINLMGNVGKDPELRYTNSGIAVASLSIAVTKKDHDKEKTLWFKIIAFEKSAENISKFVKKGMVFIVNEGQVDYNTWQKDGVEKSEMIVIANTFRWIEKEKKDNKKPETTPPPYKTPKSNENLKSNNDHDEDDLPF